MESRVFQLFRKGGEGELGEGLFDLFTVVLSLFSWAQEGRMRRKMLRTFLIVSQDGDRVLGEGIEGGEPGGGGADEGDEEPGDGWEGKRGGFGDDESEGGGEEADEGGPGEKEGGDFEVADSDGAEGSDFGESFADVDESEVSESEEGSGGDEGAEDAGEAGAFGAGGLAVFENGLFCFAGAVAGFVAGFGTDKGGGSEFDDLNVGEDG